MTSILHNKSIFIQIQMTLEQHRFELHDSLIHKFFSINTCTIFDLWLGVCRCGRLTMHWSMPYYKEDLSIHEFWYTLRGWGALWNQSPIGRQLNLWGSRKLDKDFKLCTLSVPLILGHSRVNCITKEEWDKNLWSNK